jgi:hypothetical protein
MEIKSTVAHTALDRPELVDPQKLADIALALRDLLLALEKWPERDSSLC